MLYELNLFRIHCEGLMLYYIFIVFLSVLWITMQMHLMNHELIFLSLECDTNYYGYMCEFKCSDRHCKGNSPCSPIGKCTKGCTPGWLLDDCTKRKNISVCSLDAET